MSTLQWIRRFGLSLAVVGVAGCQLGGPSVASIDPPEGPVTGGTSVTITGSGFVDGATVTIGGQPLTGVTVAHGTTHGTLLTGFTSPGTAGSADVVVTTPSGSGPLTGGFQYAIPPPQVASVSPAEGPTSGGTTVVIAGIDFTDVTSVTIGGEPLTGLSMTSPSITGVTPASAAGARDLVVTTAHGAATLALGFTYTPLFPV